jgi:hypothetical protein
VCGGYGVIEQRMMEGMVPLVKYNVDCIESYEKDDVYLTCT